ncbi:MAG: hypothetical protein ACE5HV_16275 [Acidobacteriota bacterium]
MALWLFSGLAGLTFAVTCLAALNELIFGEPAPSEDYLAYLAGSALLLVALLHYWRRYWFLASDLEMLLQARGGRGFQVQQRWLKSRIKARVTDLWLLARFDHPIFDYWPATQFDLRMRDLLQSPKKWNLQPHTWKKRGGFRPWYMLSLSCVNLFRLGDFSRLPQVDLQMTKEWSSEALPAQTHEPVLDNVLRSAANTLTDPDTVLTVEIREKWLRVEVRGGTWLGTTFRQRISQALDFTERLVHGLSPRFTPLDPQAWTIDLDGEGFRVSPTTSSPLSGSAQ